MPNAQRTVRLGRTYLNIEETSRAKGTTYRAPWAHVSQASRKDVVPKARRSVRLGRTYLQHLGNKVVPKARRSERLGRTYLQHLGNKVVPKARPTVRLGRTYLNIEETSRAKGTTYRAPWAHVSQHRGKMSCQRHDLQFRFLYFDVGLFAPDAFDFDDGADFEGGEKFF